jgi:hypothetical protein
MEIIMHGDFVGGNATSMGSPSNMRDVSHDDPVPQGGGLHQSPEPEPMRSRRDIYMLLGGGMTLLAGILAIINGLRGLITDSSLALGPADTFTRETSCGILVLVFGIVAVAGGISGIKRKFFALAVAGTIMGMMGGGVYGFYLGLGALIMFGLSNQDITS